MQRRVTDRIFLRLGVDGALGADELQWILFRAKSAKNPRPNCAWQGGEWAPISFVRSNEGPPYAQRPGERDRAVG